MAEDFEASLSAIDAAERQTVLECFSPQIIGYKACDAVVLLQELEAC